MTVSGVLSWLDFAGIFIFAVSGGLLAARKQLDPMGAVIVGGAAGMGGGTLRDLLLDTPVYWVRAPEYLAVAIGGALAGYLASTALVGRRQQALVWADAVGLSVFAVGGAQAALAVDASAPIAVLMGLMTAAFGGLLRDMIVNDVPLILKEEIYALAALAGAAAYVGALRFGIAPDASAIGAALIAFAVRAAAIVYGWRLPRVGRGQRPEL